MKDKGCISEFQATVSDCLIRNKSILDSMTKLHDASARVTRSISKAVTGCGCIEVNASRQSFPPGIDLPELKKYMKSHLSGRLCDECADVISSEVGRVIFYLAAICSTMGLDMDEIILKENERVKALGCFSLR